jgi:dTDP-4-amino-4,6-dideoxygalactose transaminase
MKVPFVDLLTQYSSLKPEIDHAMQSVINETAFIGGKYVTQFEKDFSAAYGVKHCIGVANGTDAIYIILRMLGIGAGDEVITTSTSWISTSEVIGQTGATPIFVDIDEYYTIDADKIEQAITSRTKAIIPVHLYGQSADILKITAIAAKHNLFVIEDCAQSHFTKYQGQNAGTFGIASTFSFYPGKNLGAYGDAGCILTNDDTLSEKCRMFANHGALVKHTHIIEGINSRLDGLQAAVLSVKLPHILEWTAKRKANAAIYTELLRNIPEVRIPAIRENSDHTFHLYVIRTKDRDALKVHLQKDGIETAIHYPVALPLMPAYAHLHHTVEDFPASAIHHQEILSLPMYPELSEDAIRAVVASVKSFFH